MFNRKQSQNDKGQGVINGSSSVRTTARLSRRAVIFSVIVLVLILGVAATLYVVLYRNKQAPSLSNDSTLTKADRELARVNEHVRAGNTSKALESARQALKEEPDNLTAIETVASLVKQKDPREAERLYSHALNVYKKQYNLDQGGGTTINYWAAATLAQDAGKVNQAKQYYQKVIDTADPSDGYHQSLVTQSRAALEKL